MLKIAILASGSGSNTESLVRYFEQSDVARVNLIVTNNPKAGVIERAKRLNVSIEVFSPRRESDKLLTTLKEQADLVLLAGYLKKIPKEQFALNCHHSLNYLI